MSVIEIFECIGLGICIGYFLGAFYCYVIIRKRAEKIGVWKELR